MLPIPNGNWWSCTLSRCYPESGDNILFAEELCERSLLADIKLEAARLEEITRETAARLHEMRAKSAVQKSTP